MSESNPGLIRRPEAAPYRWGSLSKSQQEAVKGVAQVLHDLLTRVDSDPEQWRSLPGMVRSSNSQLAFIDGDRGMGKSSVLLSIEDMFSRSTASDDVDTIGTTDDDSRPDAVRNIENSRHRLIWLDTLDMETPREVPVLLASILARIENAVCPSRGYPEQHRDIPFFEHHDKLDEALASLQRLESDVVRAWHQGNLLRATAADADAVAAEVMQAERASLQMNERLGQVLDQLADIRNGGRSRKSPIFILPVDDLDLNPLRCLELLRLLRMLSTPRLLFLVAGNIRIMEKVLQLQTAGELAQIYPGLSKDGPVQKNARDMAAEIAANNIRKLLPPGQRLRLAAFTVEQALDVKAPGTDLTLRSVLGRVFIENKVEMSTQPERQTLLTYLMFNEDPIDDVYSASSWLKASPRQIHDLIATFGAIPNENTEMVIPRLIDSIEQLAKEEWRLDYGDRQKVVDTIDRHSHAHIHFSSGFHAKQEIGERIYDSSDGVVRIVANRAGKFRWYMGPKVEQMKLFAEVPEQLASALTLLHDLSFATMPNVYSELMLPSMAKAGSQLVWIGTPESGPLFQWHCPDWSTFREHDRFRKRWNELAILYSFTLETRALAWMIAELEILLDRPTPTHTAPESWETRNEVAKLADELAERAKGESISKERRSLLKSGLVTIALLLAPESGLSSDFVRDFLEIAGTFKQRILEDAEVSRRIKWWRTRRLATVLNLEETNICLEAELDPYGSIDYLIEWLQGIANALIDATNITRSKIYGDKIGIFQKNVLDKMWETLTLTKADFTEVELDFYLKEMHEKISDFASHIKQKKRLSWTPEKKDVSIILGLADFLKSTDLEALEELGIRFNQAVCNRVETFSHHQTVQLFLIPPFNALGDGTLCPTREDAKGALRIDLNSVPMAP